MATVQFGTTTSPPDTLNKTYGFSDTLTGTFRDPVSVVRPVFITETEPIGHNYAHIAQFSRFYFVEDVVPLRNKLFEVHLKSDPMMSFRGGITTAPLVAERSTTAFNAYIADPSREFKQYEWNQYLTLGDLWSDGATSILVTTG